ncbi:MAG: glycosyltransferase family 61 protein [Luteimonas sp.]
MAKVCFLIPASPTSEFFSQIAAFGAAVAQLPWTRWEPSVSVCLGGDADFDALHRWQPFLKDVALTFVPPAITERNTFYYGQIDGLYRWAPRDADVLVRMDADTLPVDDLEDVLDFVVANECIAGVMTHFPFPRTPGLSAKQSWHQVSDGLIDRPLDFRLSYSLVGNEGRPDDRESPFYVNDGAVFFPRAVFDEFARHYLALRPRLMDRLASPYFAGQVALTLAATQMDAHTCALPMRYNFPNDAAATRKYPEELENAKIFHYLRTDTIDRQRIFRDQANYARFVAADLEGANRAFQQHVVRILGERYPFPGTSDTGSDELSGPASPSPGPRCPLQAYREAVRVHSDNVTAELTQIDAALAAASPPGSGRRQQLQTHRAIVASGLFDRAFYLAGNKDVGNAGVDPLQHYVNHGDKEGRKPNPGFDPGYYRRHTMEPAGRSGNALQDYIQFGEREHRQPCATFDPVQYLAAHPALAGVVDRPLFCFLHVGPVNGDEPPLPRPELRAAMGLAEQFAARSTLEMLMRFKQELCSTFDLPEAMRLYSEFALLPESGRLERKAIRGILDYARASGACLVELHPGGEAFTVPAPRVVGEAATRALEHVSRARFVACLDDVRVRGRSAVVETVDAALLDFEPWESRLFDCELDIDPSIFCVIGQDAWVPGPVDPSTTIQVEEAFSLLGPQTGAFGDWMYTALPRYVAADMSGHLPAVPVLVDKGLPRSILDSLRMMLRPGVEIIQVPAFRSVSVGRLWCSPSLHYAPAREVMDHRYKFDYSTPSPAAFLSVVREINRRATPAPMSSGAFGRVFLARKPSRWRKMVNHAAIEDVARARGFAIVYPEDLDFASQVALIRGAKHVVAPEGSAITLMYFANPGTRLCILNHPIIETTAYDGLLDGIDLRVLVGPIVEKHPAFEHRSSYRIDEAAFLEFLGGWLEPSS